MADTGRKTHIKRIYQNNDSDSDCWVDVERIDQLPVIVAGRQKRIYKFDWKTFESKEGVGQPKKTISDPNDDSTTIDIPIRKGLRYKFPRAAIYNNYFLSDTTNEARKTHSRRIYHHEIKEGYLVDGLPPQNPVIYRNSLGDQDEGQFIDVELIDVYWMRGDDSRDFYQRDQGLHGGMARGPRAVRGQLQKWFGKTSDPLLQEPLVEGDVEGGDPGFVLTRNPGDRTIDPPWRLDPLQNIVNVSWGGLAVIFGAEDLDAPAQE